ncbi:MAG: hypothetical protein EOP89_04850 [Lysobacteraceae bacterium]|nr:MAG: hypothetical protein EOP89_04850 [Xanthomonadaceae bacterium]
MKYTTLIFALLLSACAKSPDQSAQSAGAASSKPVFSTWYLADGTPLDLRGLSFGRTSAVLPVIQFGTTYHCQMIVDTTGDEAAGAVVVVSSTAIGLPYGTYTTACADKVASYDFTRNADGMSIARRGSAPLQYY